MSTQFTFIPTPFITRFHTYITTTYPTFSPQELDTILSKAKTIPEIIAFQFPFWFILSKLTPNTKTIKSESKLDALELKWQNINIFAI